jgi:enoyl-CoA hydratase/carnithine racemase
MIEIEDHDRVRLLRLARESKLNAFDAALYAATADALEAAQADERVHVLVLTGRGRAFSAGVDLAELERRDKSPEHKAFVIAANRFLAALEGFEKPLLAAVNGLAIGIGTTLLCYADLVFAARSALFRTPFASLGVAPEFGSSWRLPQVVGWQHAAWMLLSSEWVGAERAVETGLAYRAVEDHQLVAETLDAAALIAQHPLASLTAIKRTLRAWRHGPSQEALARETEEFRALLDRGALRAPF